MSSNDDLFDISYRNKDDIEVSESLVSFLTSDIALKFFPKSDISLLELGVGAKSLLESERLSFINERLDFYEGIDSSLVAIEKARQSSSRNFVHSNICTYKSNRLFNTIIDAHCLHTICDDEDRKKFFKVIYSSLDDGGVFFLETMVAPKNASDLLEYKYDELTKTLLKNGRSVIKLEDAFSIENEVLSCGLEIIFFYCPFGLKFIPEAGRDVTLSNDPDVLRLIARKRGKQEV